MPRLVVGLALVVLIAAGIGCVAVAVLVARRR
jgi:hypothetical protein